MAIKIKIPAAAVRATFALEDLASMIASSRTVDESLEANPRSVGGRGDYVFEYVSDGIPLRQSFINSHPLR